MNCNTFSLILIFSKYRTATTSRPSRGVYPVPVLYIVLVTLMFDDRVMQWAFCVTYLKIVSSVYFCRWFCICIRLIILLLFFLWLHFGCSFLIPVSNAIINNNVLVSFISVGTWIPGETLWSAECYWLSFTNGFYVGSELLKFSFMCCAFFCFASVCSFSNRFLFCFASGYQTST
jgi:hypothetical protein